MSNYQYVFFACDGPLVSMKSIDFSALMKVEIGCIFFFSFLMFALNPSSRRLESADFVKILPFWTSSGEW